MGLRARGQLPDACSIYTHCNGGLNGAMLYGVTLLRASGGDFTPGHPAKSLFRPQLDMKIEREQPLHLVHVDRKTEGLKITHRDCTNNRISTTCKTTPAQKLRQKRCTVDFVVGYDFSESNVMFKGTGNPSSSRIVTGG